MKDFFFLSVSPGKLLVGEGGPKRQQVINKEMDVSEDMYCV
jgi:hypothetical protein